MEFLNIEKETAEEFEHIAQMLFNDYAIQTHNALYRLTEIEFYWHSDTHVDKSTYGRHHVDPDAGQWFFHYSGVDIALRNRNTGGFGGILIRGLYDLNEKENKRLTNGPQVCAMKLFSGTSAFSASIQTRIISYPFNKSSVISVPRKGLGINARTNNAQRLNYAFHIDPTR